MCALPPLNNLSLCCSPGSLKFLVWRKHFLSYWLLKSNNNKAQYGSLMILTLTARKYLCRWGSQARKDFFLFSGRNKNVDGVTQLPSSFAGRKRKHLLPTRASRTPQEGKKGQERKRLRSKPFPISCKVRIHLRIKAVHRISPSYFLPYNTPHRLL